MPLAFADTIQLKDSSAITGKVLTEKRDQVAVDVGYTVLVVPRNQISKIVRNGESGNGKVSIVNQAPEPVSSAPAAGPSVGRPFTLRPILQLHRNRFAIS